MEYNVNSIPMLDKYVFGNITLRMPVKKYNYNDQTTEEEHVIFTMIQIIVPSVESSAFHRLGRSVICVTALKTPI